MSIRKTVIIGASSDCTTRLSRIIPHIKNKRPTEIISLGDHFSQNSFDIKQLDLIKEMHTELQNTVFLWGEKDIEFYNQIMAKKEELGSENELVKTALWMKEKFKFYHVDETTRTICMNSPFYLKGLGLNENIDFERYAGAYNHPEDWTIFNKATESFLKANNFNRVVLGGMIHPGLDGLFSRFTFASQITEGRINCADFEGNGFLILSGAKIDAKIFSSENSRGLLTFPLSTKFSGKTTLSEAECQNIEEEVGTLVKNEKYDEALEFLEYLKGFSNFDESWIEKNIANINWLKGNRAQMKSWKDIAEKGERASYDAAIDVLNISIQNNNKSDNVAQKYKEMLGSIIDMLKEGDDSKIKKTIDIFRRTDQIAESNKLDVIKICEPGLDLEPVRLYHDYIKLYLEEDDRVNYRLEKFNEEAREGDYFKAIGWLIKLADETEFDLNETSLMIMDYERPNIIGFLWNKVGKINDQLEGPGDTKRINQIIDILDIIPAFKWVPEDSRKVAIETRKEFINALSGNN